MTKANALLQVDSRKPEGCWTNDAEYPALAATANWADFVTILSKNSLWFENANALVALKKVYDAP